MLKKIIKIPGKTFSDLSLEEVASMIEADSSLRPEGNEQFASCALDEFLHSGLLKGREDLELVRTRILANIYINIPNQKHKEINTGYLKKAAMQLKQGEINAL